MPPTQPEIRLATSADATAIAIVLLQAFLEFKPLYTGGGFAATTPSAEQIQLRIAEGPVWLAARDGVTVGTVAAVKKDAHVYIRGMGVLPPGRGTGTGSRLLQQVESWAVSEGIYTLFLSTTPFLHSAIHLYEKHGFRRSDRAPHDLLGTPLFSMQKIISS